MWILLKSHVTSYSNRKLLPSQILLKKEGYGEERGIRKTWKNTQKGHLGKSYVD